MSDTFDHWGDAWDSMLLSEGDPEYFGDDFPQDPWCVTCKRCGTPGLKWGLRDGGAWQLYENERVEHNRLKEHVCPQDVPTADGFEDVE